MALEFVVLWAGRHQRDRWEALCDDYRRRIRRVLPISDRAVRARPTADGAARRSAEAEALRQALPAPAWTVALDRGGRARSSEDLARQVDEWRLAWPHAVVFLLGSDLGLDPALIADCRERLSFGPLTLPHELARLLLYEQLYRALSIADGIGYHR